MARQAGLFTPAGLAETNETATKQAGVGFIVDLNETVGQAYPPWSEPVRQRILPGLVIALIASGAFAPVLTTAQFPETVTEDRWHQPWSEPARSQLRAVQYQASTFVATVASAESITVDKWFVGFSEPVRTKPSLGAALQQYYTTDPLSLTRPETVSYDRWGHAWSIPVRITPRLQTGNQQAFFFDDALPYTEESRWHQAWSEPVRQKPRLKDGIQQAFFSEAIPLIPFHWVYPWSEPVRIKALLPTPEQRDYFATQTTTFAEKVTEDRWHQPWSEPVRLPRRVTQHLDQGAPRQFTSVTHTLVLAVTETADTLAVSLQDQTPPLAAAIVSIIELATNRANVGIVEVLR